MVKKFDLTSEIPNVELRISEDRSIVLGLDEMFDYACLNAEKGSLKDRMPAITKKFNEDHDCNVTAGNLYLVLYACLQEASNLMGN